MPTISNKQEALDRLEKRKAENKDKDWGAYTSSLYAGSPMYFGCIVCNGAIVLPESYQPPRPKLCNECEGLKEMGWLE
jgi:hypothetical protein